ncbi:hypothetical protein WJX82_006133 [Trebouxia sp. C0006]
MAALSASDSSPSPPPAKRNRLADAQPDNAAPANYSWAADALAAITQAGSAAEASAAKHASPTRQRGWSPAQDISLQAPAPALQASAHDVSAMPNSPLTKRSRSSARARASSARQSKSPSAHTSKSRKGFSARLGRSPARRQRSPTRQRRSPGRSPRGKFWQHKVWQERVRAQLQGPDIAAGDQDSLPYSPSRIFNRGFLPISVQASIAAVSGTLPEYSGLAPCSAVQGHARSLRDHSPMHRGRLASPRAVDLSARAAGDSPRSCESALCGSVAWHRGRRPDLSDPLSVPRGAISSPRDAASGPSGAFSTPRTLLSGPTGSTKWSDARSSSPRPDGSKHRLGRSERLDEVRRRTSSRRSAQQYTLRPSRSRSASPPRRSAEQRMSTPTNPRSRHSAEQPRPRLSSPKADCFSRRSAELPMPRAASVKPSASSRRLAEDDLPSAAHSSILHPAAATTLPPPPPIQPPVKAGGALQTPSQKPLTRVKSPFLLASHSSAKAGRASTDELRALGSVPTDPRKRPPAVKSLFGIDGAASPINKILPNQMNADKAFLAGDTCQATSDQLKAPATDLKPDSSQHAQNLSAPHPLQAAQRAGGLPSAVTAGKQPTGGDIHEPSWDEAIRNSGALQLEAKVWYYLDPKGNTQGPCSLEQLIFWLDLLKHEKAYQKEYEDFKEVSVWIVS